jgi:hypothetical protein
MVDEIGKKYEDNISFGIRVVLLVVVLIGTVPYYFAFESMPIVARVIYFIIFMPFFTILLIAAVWVKFVVFYPGKGVLEVSSGVLFLRKTSCYSFSGLDGVVLDVVKESENYAADNEVSVAIRATKKYARPYTTVITKKYFMKKNDEEIYLFTRSYDQRDKKKEFDSIQIENEINDILLQVK